MKINQHPCELFLSSGFLLICYFVLCIFAVEFPQTLPEKTLLIKQRKKKTLSNPTKSMLSKHKIEESVGMYINTGTAALGSGVKTNDSITIAGKATEGIQTRGRLYQSSHLFFGHKKKTQTPKEYVRNWSRSESGGGKYIN